MTSSNGNVCAFLVPCEGNPPATGEFPSQRPVTRSFRVSLICAWTNGWANNRDAGELRRHRAHYEVTLVTSQIKQRHVGWKNQTKYSREDTKSWFFLSTGSLSRNINVLRNWYCMRTPSAWEGILFVYRYQSLWMRNQYVTLFRSWANYVLEIEHNKQTMTLRIEKGNLQTANIYHQLQS